MDPNTQELVMGAAGASGGAPIYVEDVFSTYLYTGNGSTQTITNGIDLSGKGGLVWMKSRTVAQNNWLFDTARPTQFGLVSNLTNAEINQGSGFSSFNSNGFSLSGQTGFNGSSENIVSWTFRKTAKFFDVVTYTGNGVNRTISHNLGSVPGCIIVKRTDSPDSWRVYHRSLAASEYLTLSSNEEKFTDTTLWNNTAPTSTVFSVGTAVEANANGGAYVAYLFAHNAGGFGDSGNDNVISCGSYTGNGSNNGPTINLGWEPQWLMFKRTDTTLSDGWWFMFDNMRGVPVGGNTATLGANRSDGEFSVVPTVDFTSTGFKLTFGQANVNASGGTFIYIAIRRGPMKTPANGTQVFALSSQANNTVPPYPNAFNAGFPPDWAFFKTRGLNGSNWRERPRLTGNQYKALNSADSEATQDSALATISSQNELAVQSTVAASATNIIYAFRRAPGFFDVVAYTGTGSARTVSHNLGVAPELIITKPRNFPDGWGVYAAALGATQRIRLDLSNAANSTSAYWNNTSPTASVFTVGTDTATNGNTYTYIAYLFATCPGVSKVGSYTGTGNSTLNVNCGFTTGARFVLIKRTDNTGDWYVWDSARGLTVLSAPYLLFNSNAAEVTNTTYINSISTGFSVSVGLPEIPVNITGASYIYLAIA